MMRTEARTQLTQQRLAVSRMTEELELLGSGFRSRPLRNQCEQELADARDLEKTFVKCYINLVNSELTEYHRQRRRIQGRIDAIEVYDLDLEEDLMTVDMSIGFLLNEAEGLGFDIENGSK